MKLYQWCAPERHQCSGIYPFYGEYAIVTDLGGYTRRDMLATYRWMRKTVDRHYARHFIWRMVANPIAYPENVEIRNDLRTKAGAA